MLDTENIQALNHARDILSELEEECRRDSFNVPADGPVDGFDFGKLAEASDAASGAIFNVLNVARAYCKIAVTDEQMHNRKPEEVEVS